MRWQSFNSEHKVASQVLLQRAVARLGVNTDRRRGGGSLGERVVRFLHSIVTRRGREVGVLGRAETEVAGAATNIGISGI